MENTKTVSELQERLNAILEEMNGGAHPAKVEGAKDKTVYRAAFWEHMHTGAPENALKEGSDGAGGYLVPETYEEKLVQGLLEKNVLRRICTIVPTTHRLDIPVALEGGEAQWVDESHPFTGANATFGKLTIDAYKLATSILVSDELLEDSGADLEAYIGSIFAERIGRAEEEAFLRGDGIGKPLGLLRQAPVGVVTESAGEVHMDDVLDLIHSVKVPYRDKSVFLCSQDAYGQMLKLRHFDGKPVWEKALSKDAPNTLFGHPALIATSLEDVAPGSKPILFGDFSYFWIAERGKRVFKRLSERYADIGQVSFLTSERVDAKLVLPEAIKALEIKL